MMSFFGFMFLCFSGLIVLIRLLIGSFLREPNVLLFDITCVVAFAFGVYWIWSGRKREAKREQEATRERVKEQEKYRELYREEYKKKYGKHPDPPGDCFLPPTLSSDTPSIPSSEKCPRCGSERTVKLDDPALKFGPGAALGLLISEPVALMGGVIDAVGSGKWVCGDCKHTW